MLGSFRVLGSGLFGWDVPVGGVLVVSNGHAPLSPTLAELIRYLLRILQKIILLAEI